MKTISQIGKLLKPKTCRALTTGEIVIARSIFGDDLRVSDIKMCTHPFVLKGYAMSPNGHIYFHPNELPEDFSLQKLSMRSWFVHELTHVWQVQQGLKVVRGALLNRKYQYAFKQGKDFLTYGIEQQAQMVQDYYEAREKNQCCHAFEACIPFLKQT